MNGVLKFHHFHFFPHSLQPFVIPPLPILQQIQFSHQNQRRRKLHHLPNIPSLRSKHVRRRVISIFPLRQKRLPKPIRKPQIQRSLITQPNLRLRSLLSAEKRLRRYEPNQSHLLQRVLTRSHCHVVPEIPSGAFPQNEATA
ncbi:hypothetical protein IC575_020964 [Cucumis melo]